jgi:CHAT domain-containing protein/Tfp pilus assembly protein PilF
MVLLAALAGLGAACRRSPAPVASGTPQPAPPKPRVQHTFPLAPGAAVPHQLAGGQLDVYEIDLAEGSYLDASFEQQGVDLVVDVFAPGHRRLFHVDSPNRDQGPEALHLVAETPGRYRLEVTTDEGASPGKYLPNLKAIRTPSAIDRSQAAADRAFYEAKEIDSDSSRFWEAMAKYEKSILLFQEAGDRWHLAYAYFRLATLQINDKQPREALDAFSRSEKLFRDLQDRHFTAASLSEKGHCFQDLEDFDRAEDSYRRALDLARQTGEAKEVATILGNLGRLLQSEGQSWNALGFLRQALDLWHGLSGSAARLDEAEILTDIGWVYTSTGDWQRAADAHWRALRLRNRLGDRLRASISLTQIGSAWLHTDARRALPFLERAWELQKEFKSPSDQAAILNGLGLAQRLLGHYDEANATYRKALELYGGAGDQGGQAVTWNNLGWTFVYLNHPDRALKSFEQGLRLARRTRNRLAEARALQGMAAAESKRGNVTVAQVRGEESLKIIEALRAAVVRPDLQTSYLAANENVYGLLIRILMEHHRQQPAGGFDVQALNRSEQARARVLVDSLRESRELRSLQSKVAPELLALRRQLLARIGVQDFRRRRLDTSPAEISEAERELDGLLDQLGEIDLEIRRSRQGAVPGDPPVTTLDEQRRRLLDGDTVLLEYYLGSPHGYLWAVSRDGIQSFELPGSEALEPLLRSAYERLAGIAKDEPAGDRRLLELSRLILGPVVNQIRGKRLLISADGAQQYIPFAALPEPGGRHEPLLLRHEIVYVPSLHALAELRNRGEERQPASQALALLADAVFDATDSRLSPAGSKGTGIERQDTFYPRLQSSRAEARVIAGLLPAGATFTALDFDASCDLVTSGRLSKFRMIHIATHGLQRSDRPELSALVLSRYDRQGTPREGYLRAPDVALLDLPAELVVLSGCETALGPQIPGEGLVGLPQAFFAAGAQRVLVSLWHVEDESTAALMVSFYRHLLVEHMPPGKALREAQLAIRSQPRWTSPRYWAGFVLQGDWR